MNWKHSIFFITTLFMTNFCEAQQNKSLAIDPFNVKEFTLKNGLKIFISPNPQAPRIQTMIAVKAGSKYDPAQTTGLAHYLEHMMFKGTSKYGTLDWKKESELLAKIAAKYEEHLREKDEEKKKEIYSEIDKLSYEASKYAIPSEYDKMIASIGASGTNAFTANDMTVYVNDIPSNAVDKWAKLEAERFSELVLRLFHTELETVYEEFNISQDRDSRWSHRIVDSLLMPNHPYGTQTTIGEGEHLKNPSMVNIHNYFNQYYVPNNCAIVLCGDVNEKVVLPILEKYFGNWERKDVPKFVMNPPVALNTIQRAELLGPDKEHLVIGFRLDGDGSREALLAKMLDMMLNNGNAGLLDLNLLQKQKVLAASSYANSLKDYTTFNFYAEPKQGQSLEEVEKLLIEQLNEIKKGNFDEWLLKAIVQNLKLQQMQYTTQNESRAYIIVENFVKDLPWSYRVNELDELSKITKQDMIDFVNKYFGDNYAICYKRIGEPNRHKVDKPTITPVVLNLDSVSTFKQDFDQISIPALPARFVDFDKDIIRENINNTELLFVENKQNKLFNLTYEINEGTYDDKRLLVLGEYINYLGTEKYSPAEVKQEFYKLGITPKSGAKRDKFFVSISGLEENLEKGIKLWQTILTTLKADSSSWNDFVADILKKRKNAKLNKDVILNALSSYAKYGEQNPFKYILSEEELKNLKPEELTAFMKTIAPAPDVVKFYGSKNGFAKVKNEIAAHKVIRKQNKKAARIFPEKNIEKPVVYFCNYNMKQAQVLMHHKDENYNKDMLTATTMYNEYYGSGLSSIMFQEVREKMGLAYAVSSWFSSPVQKDEAHYLSVYVGTQADKLKTTITEVNRLMNNFVYIPKQFDGIRENVIKNTESDWTQPENYFTIYENAMKKGLNYDVRQEIYKQLKTFTNKDLENLFNTKIKNQPFAYCIVGNKADINMDYLKSIGEIQELTLEEIFGY